VGDRSGEATTLNSIGAVYDSISHRKKHWNTITKLYQLSGQWVLALGKLRPLIISVECTTAFPQPEEALNTITKLYQLGGQWGDLSGEATTLSNIG
jgi:hypothetical protein